MVKAVTVSPTPPGLERIGFLDDTVVSPIPKYEIEETVHVLMTQSREGNLV